MGNDKFPTKLVKINVLVCQLITEKVNFCVYFVDCEGLKRKAWKG